MGEELKVVVGVLCAVWVVVGTTAASQRQSFGPDLATCDSAATVAVTVAAGPLNYHGVNPAVTCPEPSA